MKIDWEIPNIELSYHLYEIKQFKSMKYSVYTLIIRSQQMRKQAYQHSSGFH